MYGSIIGGTDDSGMYGSTIGGTDVTIAVCTAVPLVVQNKLYVRQYHWWYRCDDSGMYGSIIGGTDVMIAVCTAVPLVEQMSL